MVISAPDNAADPAKSGRDSIRYILRLLLYLSLLLLFFVVDDFVSHRFVPPLPRFLGEFLVVVILALTFYLFLVRIEAGRWGLVHPVLRDGLGAVRANRDYKMILLAANGCFFTMVAVSVLSGYVYSRSGQQFVVLSLSVLVMSDLIVLWFLGKEE